MTTAKALEDDYTVPEEHRLLDCVLASMLAPYWINNPTAEACLDAIQDHYQSSNIVFDHFAFRSWGLEQNGKNLGICALSSFFQDFGYHEIKDQLVFPAKKLVAKWYSPPHPSLPRIFISELQVDQMSQEAQRIMNKYSSAAPGPGAISKHAAMMAMLGMAPWPVPTLEDYRILAKESEYAAWVLTNGYSLNHTTISVHRIAQLTGGIASLNKMLVEEGFKLNEEGGQIKVSPDGLLLQSSTIADRHDFEFLNGEVEAVPASYIEFAERLPLPEYSEGSILQEELRELHRRDGFEVGNADKIFESTTLASPKLKQ